MAASGAGLLILSLSPIIIASSQLDHSHEHTNVLSLLPSGKQPSLMSLLPPAPARDGAGFELEASGRLDASERTTPRLTLGVWLSLLALQGCEPASRDACVPE